MTIKFDVLNRFSGKVQFTAEIECHSDASAAVKIGLAARWGLKSGANLSGANLSGANLRDANLRDAYLRGADLRGADLSGADLRGANLRDANLSGANLRGADLSDANLRGANLRDANLSDANLRDANLRGADLSGADLSGQWIIQGPTRSDGYVFFLQKLTGDKEPRVKAGCRYFTIPQAQAHWEATRAGTPLFDETRSIVRCMVDLMHIRGLK